MIYLKFINILYNYLVLGQIKFVQNLNTVDGIVPEINALFIDIEILFDGQTDD